MSYKFNLGVREKNGYAILDTEGYVDQSGGESIAEEIDKLMDKDIKHFIVNFEKTKIINSTALSIITGVVVKTSEIDGTIAFTNMSRLIHQTFKIMGLTDYSTLYETEEEAVKQVSGILSV